VQLVARQAERWTAPQLRLTRRCTPAGLRVRVDGRDADFARDVSFKLGRKLAVRDTDGPPFAGMVPRGAVPRTRANRVRTVASLRAGAPGRVVLERTLPRC